MAIFYSATKITNLGTHKGKSSRCRITFAATNSEKE